MVRLVHNLSEFTGRPGPFGPDEVSFKGFDPPRARAEARLRRIGELMDVLDYSPEAAAHVAHFDQAEWAAVGRYHMIIFSNFLTRSEDVAALQTELDHVFRALKPGGVVVVVGGTGAHYPEVYRSIEQIARRWRARRVTKKLRDRLRCKYDNAEAREIKRLYTSVVDRLREVTSFQLIEAMLPRDLWDRDAPLRGPKAFGLRVFRGPDRPPGVRFGKVG